MMSNYKGLINLDEISPQEKCWAGAIFRMYNVGRLDAKSAEENYYDLMLVDISTLAENKVALINVTANSDNRGRLVALIPNTVSKYFVIASDMQHYFNEQEVYYVEDVSSMGSGAA